MLSHPIPCHTIPCHAMPCHATPSHPIPSQARASLARLVHAWQPRSQPVRCSSKLEEHLCPFLSRILGLNAAPCLRGTDRAAAKSPEHPTEMDWKRSLQQPDGTASCSPPRAAIHGRTKPRTCPVLLIAGPGGQERSPCRGALPPSPPLPRFPPYFTVPASCARQGSPGTPARCSLQHTTLLS